MKVWVSFAWVEKKQTILKSALGLGGTRANAQPYVKVISNSDTKSKDLFTKPFQEFSGGLVVNSLLSKFSVTKVYYLGI